MPVAGHEALTATIAKDGSVSGEVAIEGRIVASIGMSAGWDAADMTFQGASTSDGAFQDIYDDAGTELSITVSAGRCVVLTGAEADALAAVPYVKVRSGTTGTPVAQTTAERILTLNCR